MSLPSGTRLGPYDIQQPLGAGGMGEVYRARDTRLNRTVALKVLAPEQGSGPSAHARFEREARAVAALDHPHICGIYDVGETSGIYYLVMPLLEGQTLAERLVGGPLPLDHALTISGQVADALDKAHRNGILHRDLKPANIMLTKAGAKLLDFGLAKLRGSAGPISMSNASHLATTSPETAEGTILGTLHYMAPEQVEGREADERSDIWALGVVLYEMVTGVRPFPGETRASVIGAILKDTPPLVSSRQPLTPALLDRAVARCLEKDHAARWQSAGDFHQVLCWLNEFARTPSTERYSTRTTARLLPWAVVALASLALIIAALFTVNRPSGPGPVVTRLDLNLPNHVELSTIAAPSATLSSDGQLLAFTGHEEGFRRLFVRRLDEPRSRKLEGTDGVSQCYFSRDNTAVVCLAQDRTIKKISLADGLTRVLARGVDRNLGGSWGADDRVTFVRDGRLWQSGSEGGDATPLTTLDKTSGELFHGWPASLNGGRTVLFTSVKGGTRDASRIEAIDTATGQRHVITEPGMYPMYAGSGHLVFLQDNALVAAPFDAQRLALTGPAVRLAEDVAIDAIGAPLASLSESGGFVYISREAASSQVVWVTRDGVAGAVSDQLRAYDYPRLSPDGSRILSTVSGDVWQMDTVRSTFTRVTAEAAVGNSYGTWLPDGKRFVFRTAMGLRVGNADGSGEPVPIAGTAISDFPNAISADGKTLVFTRQTANASGEVYALSLEGDPAPHPVFSTPAYDGGAQLSPDGRWITYASDESGQYEVYVRPFPAATTNKWPASAGGGTQPRWSRDGSELFYRNGSRMLVVKVRAGAELTLSRPEVLFDHQFSFGTGVTFPQYDVAPDGRFVMIRRDADFGRLSVVLNWTEELKRLTGK